MSLHALMRIRRPVRPVRPEVDVWSSYRPTDRVLETAGEGRVFLLDTVRSRYLGLDDVAAVVWTLMMGGLTVNEIAHGLAQEYDADVEMIESDVVKLLSGLLERGLIERA
jgi:hypothetical protein